ncbi:MAG TPA: hypothetical protein VGC41_06495 [Kofleriaceae bacterium]
MDDAPAHDESSDFDEVEWSHDGKADFSGVPATFDHNAIVDDTVFTRQAVDGDAVQAFLEHTPYGTRSWLADYTISGERFADRMVEIAADQGIDPVMLLVRLQVESSVVSKTKTPTASTLSHATGCGCPDGGGCSGTYSGFENQLVCTANIYRKWYDASTNGSGQWRTGHAHKSLDSVSVTPRYDATATIYAYTPWVLVNRGGAWLTWNVTRRFLKHFDQAGTLDLP